MNISVKQNRLTDTENSLVGAKGDRVQQVDGLGLSD